jgi:hypothetical protein
MLTGIYGQNRGGSLQPLPCNLAASPYGDKAYVRNEKRLRVCAEYVAAFQWNSVQTDCKWLPVIV